MQGSDAWSAVAELAATQHGVFHKNQAAANGIRTRQLARRVADRWLVRPLSDVYGFPSHRRSWRQRCMIASLAGGVVSHRSAAALHQLDGFPENGGWPIEVTFERDRVRNLPGVVAHTWRGISNDDITIVDGIRCTSIARTLAHLGAVCGSALVEKALDSALRRGVSPRWIENTVQRLWRSGPTGVQTLATIIADPRREGALPESWLERVVEGAVVHPDMPRPVRQHPVRLPSGIRRLDLAFPDARLGIEAHSRTFHFGPRSNDSDHVRDFELAAAGWEVLYITWGMAHDFAPFMHLLEQTYRVRRSQIARGGLVG